jgi:hypothetical protein
MIPISEEEIAAATAGDEGGGDKRKNKHICINTNIKTFACTMDTHLQ